MNLTQIRVRMFATQSILRIQRQFSMSIHFRYHISIVFSVSNETTPNSTQNSESNWNKEIQAIVETIDLLDSDSENMLQERADSPVIGK